MKIERGFVLNAPLDVIWSSLKDTQLMSQCLPGAELTEDNDPDNLRGSLSVRLGPVAAVFKGTVAVTRDEISHAGSLHAEGIDKRTRTRVRADITYSLFPDHEGTKVALVCEFSLAGALAQFARQTLIDKVACELIEGFSNNLQQRLTSIRI